MARSIKHLWQHLLHVLSVPLKIALSASAAFIGVSGWLNYIDERKPTISILCGMLAAAITGGAAGLGEAKHYQASFAVVRTRTTRHIQRHKVFSAGALFVVVATVGAAWINTIISDGDINQKTELVYSTPKVESEALGAVAARPLQPELASSQNVFVSTEPQIDMAMAFVELEPAPLKQTAEEIASALAVPQPLAGHTPLPRPRFVNPCALDEPDNANGEFPLKDYNACLAYLKKHPPKTGIGGPGFPPLPRPRPFIESIPAFQLDSRNYLAR